MTATPYFTSIPTPPQAGTDEYTRWTKESTLNFPGGYITATYGNLIQTFSMTGTDACDGTTVSVTRKAHDRVNTIGGSSTPIAQKNFSYKKYPKRNGGSAAGGELITITTSVGSYTARLGGDIQDLVGWLCGNGTGQLYSSIDITSPNGAHYGPFAPIAAGTP